jgi:hypothetical protein
MKGYRISWKMFTFSQLGGSFIFVRHLYQVALIKHCCDVAIEVRLLLQLDKNHSQWHYCPHFASEKLSFKWVKWSTKRCTVLVLRLEPSLQSFPGKRARSYVWNFKQQKCYLKEIWNFTEKRIRGQVLKGMSNLSRF